MAISAECRVLQEAVRGCGFAADTETQKLNELVSAAGLPDMPRQMRPAARVF
jgi:hypothetical protein